MKKKENDKVYVSDNKEMADIWDEKNNTESPNTVSISSHDKFWWKCPKGHSYKMRAASVKQGHRCNICSGLVIVKGINDLESYCINNRIRNFENEWDYDLNEKHPSKISYKSYKCVWWKCHICGHKWRGKIQNYINGKSVCENCKFKDSKRNNKKIIVRKYLSECNDLLEIWDEQANVGIDKRKITLGSNKKYFWKCPKGHSYSASVKQVSIGCKCVYCSGKQVLIGYNDLKSLRPDVAEEWAWDKNEKGPEEYTVCSGESVYWRCKQCGNVWYAQINNRTSHNTNCRKCSNVNQTSFPEQTVLYYVRKAGFDTFGQYKLGKKYTLDIYIPNMKIGIEYDGSVWHAKKKNQERDEIKNNMCAAQGILLFRLCESKEKIENPVIQNNNIIFYRDIRDENLEKAISILLARIGSSFTDINISRDRYHILKSYQNENTANSFGTRCPDLVKEWDYEKNIISPFAVSLRSNTEYYWICSRGHSYMLSPDKRSQGRGCKYCKGKGFVYVGFNDLETYCIQNNRKNLLQEWDYELNNKKPCEYTHGTRTEVYWKCPICGNKWRASILSRRNGWKNCEVCKRDNRNKKI